MSGAEPYLAHPNIIECVLAAWGFDAEGVGAASLFGRQRDGPFAKLVGYGLGFCAMKVDADVFASIGGALQIDGLLALNDHAVAVGGGSCSPP